MRKTVQKQRTVSDREEEKPSHTNGSGRFLTFSRPHGLAEAYTYTDIDEEKGKPPYIYIYIYVYYYYYVSSLAAQGFWAHGHRENTVSDRDESLRSLAAQGVTTVRTS